MGTITVGLMGAHYWMRVAVEGGIHTPRAEQLKREDGLTEAEVIETIRTYAGRAGQIELNLVGDARNLRDPLRRSLGEVIREL